MLTGCDTFLVFVCCTKYRKLSFVCVFTGVYMLKCWDEVVCVSIMYNAKQTISKVQR
jgi:hypothetical protein